MKRSMLFLVALTLLFGAQSIRVLIPSLVWYLYTTLGMNVWLVVLMGYGTLVLGLAAPLWVRWLKPRLTLGLAGAGLVACRLVEQVSIQPGIDLWVAVGGSVCFLWMVPLLFGQCRAEGEDGLGMFALGMLLGLSLDTALRGLTGTLNLSSIPGLWPITLMVALVSGFSFALWRATRGEVTLHDANSPNSLALLGLGLFLFVQWLIFQNQGWVAALTGWSSGVALGLIMLCNSAALLAATWSLKSARWHSTRWWLLLPGGMLTLVLFFVTVPYWVFAIGELVGLVSVGLLLVSLTGEPRYLASSPGIARVSFAFGIGWLLFYTFVSLYYASFLAPVPFPRSILAPFAGFGLAICAMLIAWRRPPAQMPQASTRKTREDWVAMGLSALLLLAPLAVLLAETRNLPAPSLAHGYPVRVMTYNIRAAHGMDGRQDAEAIAEVIEGANVEVVVLQEIERGWFLSGNTDLFAWLARRLNMPYALMGAVTDPLSGNAILSRYPVLASGTGILPQLDTFVGRGYLWAQLDLGDGARLQVITTHLHHEPPRNDVRIAQVEALLGDWKDRQHTVLMGDLNAIPGSPEIQIIFDNGLVDAWTEAGRGDRPPIDWIFHTPDLVASQVTTVASQASDHLAVIATLSSGP